MKKRPISVIIRDRWLYLLLLPGLLYFLLFKYLPMAGILIAFKDFQPFLGFFRSAWVGGKHFNRLFTGHVFWMLFRNTMLIGLYNIVFFFPLPIAIALMLNEVGNLFYKRLVQTVIYIPHFISWVVVVGITYVLFTTNGIVNQFLTSLGLEKINFLLNPSMFRPMIVFQVIWKETGWGTIILLATLSGIDPQLYEAASIDGANRWHQMLHITLPSLRSTIVILLLIRLGRFLNTGFQQIFLMLNPLTRDVGEVFDTYVYSIGITGGQFSYSAAVGFFKSSVGLILIYITNRLAKRMGEEGIF